jgi:hypothetical protein
MRSREDFALNGPKDPLVAVSWNQRLRGVFRQVFEE